MVDRHKLALMVKVARVKKGMNQETLAKLAGVNIATISFLENGTKKTKIETLIKIAEVLELDLNELL